MTNTIGGITLDRVNSIDFTSRRTLVETPVASGLTYWSDLANDTAQYLVRGYLTAYTAAKVDSLKNLRYAGQPVLVDLESTDGVLGYAKVQDVRGNRIGTLYQFEMMILMVPAVGVTYVQTPEAWLHDLDYRAAHRVFNPSMGRFNLSYTADNLDHTWEYYLDNDKTASQTLIAESQVGDDLDKFKLYGWKAAAWSLIGDWGGADAWDAVKAWTDGGAVAHNFRLNKGVRGQALAGIGTISKMLGLQSRVLFSVTSMSAQGATDVSTDYSADQLLLRAVAEHTSREALRPYPVVTMVDGSLSYGRA